MHKIIVLLMSLSFLFFFSSCGEDVGGPKKPKASSSSSSSDSDEFSFDAGTSTDTAMGTDTDMDTDTDTDTDFDFGSSNRIDPLLEGPHALCVFESDDSALMCSPLESGCGGGEALDIEGVRDPSAFFQNYEECFIACEHFALQEDPSVKWWQKIFSSKGNFGACQSSAP